MTHQTIRISLMLWERLLKSLNAALLTALLCVALYALVTNLSEARGAIGKLFVKFTQIESIEGFNVKAAFRVDQIAQATPIYQALPADMKDMLPDDIRSLRASWVERLLYVGDQGKLCEFESPTQKMIEDHNADRHLSADGLITMKDSREVKAQVLEDMRQAKAQEPWVAEWRAPLLLCHRTHRARQKRQDGARAVSARRLRGGDRNASGAA